MRMPKLVSSPELSVQLSLIPPIPTFEKVRFVGATGAEAGGLKVKTVLEPSAALFRLVMAALAVKLVVMYEVEDELKVGVTFIVVNCPTVPAVLLDEKPMLDVWAEVELFHICPYTISMAPEASYNLN